MPAVDLDEALRELAREAVALRRSLTALETAWRRELLIALLTAERGNQVKVAARIGVHRNTVARLMARTGLAVWVSKQPGKSSQKVIATVREAMDLGGENEAIGEAFVLGKPTRQYTRGVEKQIEISS